MLEEYVNIDKLDKLDWDTLDKDKLDELVFSKEDIYVYNILVYHILYTHIIYIFKMQIFPFVSHNSTIYATDIQIWNLLHIIVFNTNK